VDGWLPWKPLLDANGNPVRLKNGKIKMQRPTASLDQTRRAAAMAWAPGEPEFIHDRLPVDAGWVTKAGAITFNNYRPPVIAPGDAQRAQRWLDHWHAIYPSDEATHCIAFLAHLVQRPAVKINHCIVLVGAPKIGKDTLLEPMETAVGPGNYKEITLSNLISKNNEFLRAVFVRLSEARDMGEQGRIDRYGLHDHTKNLLATPPNMLRINEKYIREYYIVNCFGMAVTSNHRDAFFLTPDDRRYFVATSECGTGQFSAEYWSEFWTYYNHDNGINDVVALLRQYDLSGFDPKAPPPKTPGFWHMVNADRGEEHGALNDAIEALDTSKHPQKARPKALTINQLVAVAPHLEWLAALKMRRSVGKRLGDCGYIAVDNPATCEGLWIIGGKRQRIYARTDMTPDDRLAAAQKLAG
jgi:hypothetical protein